MGKDEAYLTKNKLGWKFKKFEIPEYIRKNWLKISSLGKEKRIKWDLKFKKSKSYKLLLSEFKKEKINRDSKTNNFLEKLISNEKKEATRKSSQRCIEFFSTKIKNFLGGSADLTSSNLTKTKYSNYHKRKFNYIHYGVREHLMAAAMNGISVHGGFLPYGGTFLVFSDYCKNSIRLSSMMKQQVIYVFTHDSIGLGEDGPTHQPIEHLASLRSIPNLFVIRPCDPIETFEAWEFAVNKKDSPTALNLSRKNLPIIRSDYKNNMLLKGGYFIKKIPNSSFTIISSGSEVSLAIDVHKKLLKNNISCSVVSMPSMELFDKQSSTYKSSILDKKPKVVIEAASSFGWHKYLNQNDLIFSVDRFGESGKGDQLFDFFGFNCNNICNLIKKKIIK